MVRKAVLDDVLAIHGIIDIFARKGTMLPRTTDDITKNLREFFVYEEDGTIAGVSALSLCWKDIGEVRSLAVKEGFTLKGIGSSLVASCIDEAKELGLGKVFALTYQAGFFEKLGFHVIDKTELPQKIWGDCVRCCKFPSCDETAVIIDL